MAPQGDKEIISYGWDKYEKFYPQYRKLTQTFRCAEHSAEFSAAPLIGNLSHDWHPLGFSERDAGNPCIDQFEPCRLSLRTIPPNLVKHFGARTFLFENAPLEELPGLLLIDFTRPRDQLIPDIGEQAAPIR
jgi:hypothetical protein